MESRRCRRTAVAAVACLAGADEWRGGEGPLILERGPATNPLFSAFFEAVQQAGYPLTDDVNGYRQEGFARFDRNLHRGRRLSAARAYLHPVRKRENLDVDFASPLGGQPPATGADPSDPLQAEFLADPEKYIKEAEGKAKK